VSVKRLNYFTHQFLREQDFKDEQAYHLDMRRRHNQLLHGWGIVEGLEVQRKGEREITISPGTAIDRDGREIIVLSPVTRDLGSFDRGSHTFITVAYGESWEEADHHAAGGIEGYTRVTESPEFNEKRHQPPKDGAAITLARVQLNEVGHVGHIDADSSIRKRAGIVNPAAGWMRLPFKPIRMNPARIDGRRVRIVNEAQLDDYEFIVDEYTAYCDDKGALGSMEIPVPPAATNLVGFRIAGTTRGKVTVHLFRVGWNLHENKGEKTKLLEQTVNGPSFHKDIPVETRLDESHALAVSVRAEGESTIWLVAAKFE
jgi:hypothetical protein